MLEDIAIAARVTGILPMTLGDLLAVAIQEAEQTPALLEHRSALKTLFSLYPTLGPHRKSQIGFPTKSETEPKLPSPRELRVIFAPQDFLHESMRRGGVQSSILRKLRDEGVVDLRGIRFRDDKL